MTASGPDAGRLVAEFLPERVGRYRAMARFPDGTTQESRFIVFTENLERLKWRRMWWLAPIVRASGGPADRTGGFGAAVAGIEQREGRRDAEDEVVSGVECRLGFLPDWFSLRPGLVLTTAVGTMLNEKQHILDRLAAADRAHQKEAGGRFLLRSVKYLCVCVLAAFVLDVVFHLRAGWRLGLLLGIIGGVVALLGVAWYLAFVRRNRLEHIARFLEAALPALARNSSICSNCRGRLPTPRCRR